MRYTPDYTIDKVELLFNSWTFRTYSEKAGVDLDNLLPHLFTNREKLPDLLYTAAESYLKFNNMAMGYDPLDAYLWIDAIGGFNSEEIVSIWKVVIRKLYNTTADKVEDMFTKLTEGTEDKKKATGHGKSSTKKPTRQD